MCTTLSEIILLFIYNDVLYIYIIIYIMFFFYFYYIICNFIININIFIIS